ncbi:histidine phosphatase family protein [Bacillus sp. ET1]|nr:histidine phosphatase family protein [Bacillus sp. ET1]
MTQETKLYVIRHGEAKGNLPDDPLTQKGNEQAKKLIDFLLQREEIEFDRIISSPYLRAKQTADILNKRLNIGCSTDCRLKELNFGTESEDINLVDQLQRQFEDFQLKLSGGESNQEVMDRVGSLKNELLHEGNGTFILITHRVTMALLLRHFDEKRFGFNECMELTNPDVFVVTQVNGNTHIEDIWKV